MLRRLKHTVASRLRQRPVDAARAARALRRLGRHSLASRFEAATDLARVVPPVGSPFHLLLCDGRDQVARAVGSAGWDAFEAPLPEVLAALLPHCCAGGTFADVGANTGYYALLAAAVSPTTRIDAFEPFPPVVDTLRANVVLNRADSIRVIDRAVSATVGSATLFVPSDEHGLVETSASLNPDFTPERRGHEVDVDVTTLDEVYPPPHPGPALLKIDVESLEADVVRGGRAMIERTKPVLVLELLHHADPAPLEALRAEHDYVDVRLRPHELVVSEAVVADPEAWNHLWLPATRRDELLGVLRAAGLLGVGKRSSQYDADFLSTNEPTTVRARLQLGRIKRAMTRGLHAAADRVERVGTKPAADPPTDAVAPAPPPDEHAEARRIGEVWIGHPYYEEVEKFTESMWENFERYREGADYRQTLELAAGHGRHSEKLLPLVEHLTIVDINQDNIDFCRSRFGDDPRITYLVNDGDTLEDVPDASITFVYCVDAMVHFDSDSVRSYLAEFNRIMVPGARGFCHHSNYTGNPGGDWLQNPHWRNFMSRLFAHYAIKSGLRILQSNLTNWGTDNVVDLDCYTSFEKPG